MRMRNASRWFLLVAIPVAAALLDDPAVGAQASKESCTSYVPLAANGGSPLGYTVPLRYGSFADVEVAASGEGTVQIEVEALQNGAIKDRRTWILIPGRVELLTEIFGVDNLFEVGSPLVLRIDTSAPVAATLVRRD